MMTLITTILNESYGTYMYLTWFISMALGNLYPPIVVYDVVVPIILFALPLLTYTHGITRAGRQRLALLPLFWVAIAFWAGLFHHRGGVEWPRYIVQLPDYLFIAFFFYALALLFAHKGYRLLTIIMIVLNAWFAITMTFFANMAIAGRWL
jgi:hypothetical protein